MTSTSTINPDKNDVTKEAVEIKKIVFFNFEDWEEPLIKDSLNKYDIELCNETLNIDNAE